MKKYTVKDLMVPLSEYATVSQGATLFEAVMTLERSQKALDPSQRRYPAILVLNTDEEVIGKIDPVDALQALEPMDRDLTELKDLNNFSFSTKFVRNLYQQRRLQAAPLKDLCMNAAKLKVETCMQTFAEGEYIDHNATLDAAIHHLILENHIFLLVTDQKKIVGVLRLADVFAAVCHTMKACETTL